MTAQRTARATKPSRQAPPALERVRDVRPTAKADVIVESVVAAATALEPFAKERLWLNPPVSYADLRQRFATLPDDDRRRILVALLRDEGLRVQHDRIASFNGAA